MANDSGFSYLLKEVAKLSKTKPEKILQLAKQVATQESKGRADAIQVGGGPGRGMYQMESNTRVVRDADTENPVTGASYQEDALKKLKRFYRAKGVEPPQWVKDLKEGFDPATDLTADQQTMLFLAKNTTWGAKDTDLRGSTFSKINEKGFDPVEWWAKEHKRSGVTDKERNRMRAEQGLRVIANAEEMDTGFNRERSGGRGLPQLAQAGGTTIDAGMEGTGPIPVSQQQIDQEAANWDRLRAQLEQDTGIYRTPPGTVPSGPRVATEDDELFVNKLLRRFWD